MSTLPQAKLSTFDDFCAIVKEKEKADLIDGVIYMASPDNTDASRINGWLFSLMQLFVEVKDLGEVFVSRVACRLDKWNGPEPDIVFVSTKNMYRVKRGHIQGPPDLAVEVVSPESVERDYEKKRAQYERFGVPEYWIVDELQCKVILLQLGPKKKYRELPPKKGRLYSKALPGFWIQSEWLWPDSRPGILDALNQIVASK